MLELHYSVDDMKALREQPAVREAIHWGLLVKRVGPLIADGRPEMPVERSPEAEKQHKRATIARAQVFYDHLVKLIHVPEEEG